MRDREELLRNVIAHIPAAVFWKDRGGRYLGCNARFARDHGFTSPDEVVGRSDLDLPIAREEAEAFRAADRRVMDGGEPLINAEEFQTSPGGRRAYLRGVSGGKGGM